MSANFFFYLYLLGILFLPRVGILDFGIFWALAAAIFASVFMKKSYRILDVRTMHLLLALLLVCSIFALVNSSIFLDNPESFFFQKSFRYAVMAFGLQLVVERSKIKSFDLICVAMNCLLLHLFIIYAQILSPELKIWMGAFTSPQINVWVSYRAPGLANSYDAAGMLIANLLAIELFVIDNMMKKNKGVMYVLTAMTFLASMLTARVAFMSILVVFIYYLVFVKRLAINASFIAFSAFFGLLAFAFFRVMMNIDENYYYGFYRSIDTKNIFADASDLISLFFIWPVELSSLLFGTGAAPYSEYGAKGDMGYGHVLWGIGALGLLLTLVFYQFLVLSRKTTRSDRRPSTKFDAQRLCFTLVLITLVGSLKGPYLFGRGLFEILIFVWMALGRIPLNNLSQTQNPKRSLMNATMRSDAFPSP